MSRIFITGIAGFIGSHVAEARKTPQKPLQSLPPIELTENMPDVWRKLL